MGRVVLNKRKNTESKSYVLAIFVEKRLTLFSECLARNACFVYSTYNYALISIRIRRKHDQYKILMPFFIEN